MFDNSAAQLAMRARLLTLAVATTGSTTLSATATGYARAAGSFLTDGFAVGMELVATGMGVAGNNGIHVVTGISALALAVSGGLTAEGAVAGRTLVAGLPAIQVYPNVSPTPNRITGRPYIEESYTPGPTHLQTFPYTGGEVETTGLYTVRWYGVEGVGVQAIQRSADAVRDLFRPGTIITTPAGQVIRVRGDIGPSAAEIRPDTPGWAVCTITIPWRARYTN